MPLTWSVRNIKNADDVCWLTATHTDPIYGKVRGEEYLNPITDAFVWATMSIGLNEITEANIDEWESRLALAYKVGWISQMSVYNGEDWEARPLTRADLERHIGLETNASHESATAWRKRVVERMTEEGLREGKRAEKRNAELDAVWQKRNIELRDAIRRGDTTKEIEAARKDEVAV